MKKRKKQKWWKKETQSTTGTTNYSGIPCRDCDNKISLPHSPDPRSSENIKILCGSVKVLLL